ncbi:MAG: hypothetical protein HZB38_06225 [Planctomycetes bacterium]|nr:hypothetical protein [Planctomycetota bacterium]
MRKAGYLRGVLCLFSVLLVSADSPRVGQSTSRPAAHVRADPLDIRTDAENEAIWVALERPAPRFSFQETPFQEALAAVLKASGVKNTHVSWQALIDAGVGQTNPVTLTVADLPLRRALDLVLATAAGPDIRLAYEPVGGVLTVSTEEDITKAMETRVYPIRDLLTRDLAAMRARLAQVGSIGYPAVSGADAVQTASDHFRAALERMGPSGVPNGATSAPTSQPAEEDEQPIGSRPLVNAIQQSVGPDSWECNGGLGTLTYYQDSLIVRNCARVHREVGRLLNDLRASLLSSSPGAGGLRTTPP